MTQAKCPTIFIVFGGGGDLANRKIIPALFNLYLDHFLPEKFMILAIDRYDLQDDNLRQHFYKGVSTFSRLGKPKKEQWTSFGKMIFYVKGDFLSAKTYSNLAKKLQDIDDDWEVKAVHVFYMATPPSFFGEIPKYLDQAGLSKDLTSSRLVIEKPIGYDLASARALMKTIANSFHESQIFRIDHYLGKETVQNILTFRFSNPFFEPLWNSQYIDYVTINVEEEIGIEHRGAYYEKAGALRDMVQNHLMQLLCSIAMEPIFSIQDNEVRNKKLAVLQAVRPIAHEDVSKIAVRGQYDSGWIKGEQVVAYRAENGVSIDSNTETFVALKLFIDNWRWQRVPFILRTGKRLSQKSSSITIHFKPVPHQAFPFNLDQKDLQIIMNIQPKEGIHLQFYAKRPGQVFQLKTVDMSFTYEGMFKVPSPEAYETLLWDIIQNNQTLFMREDQVDAAWSIIDPILDVWSTSKPNQFPNYTAGSSGPEEAFNLMFK